MHVHTECCISVRRFRLYSLDHTSSSTSHTRLKSGEGSPCLKQFCLLHIWASCDLFYGISPYYSLLSGWTLNPLFAFWCGTQEHFGSLGIDTYFSSSSSWLAFSITAPSTSISFMWSTCVENVQSSQWVCDTPYDRVIREAEVHLGSLHYRLKGVFLFWNLYFLFLCSVNPKRQNSFCFSVKGPNNIFHMIIALGMVDFHLKVKATWPS